LRLFTFEPYSELAARLASILELRGIESFECGHFKNGELYIRLHSDVSGDPCLVLGSIAPPESNLVRFTLLCHTLAEAGADTVIALIPYLSYSRQDRRQPGFSLAAAWTGELLKASMVDDLLTLDLHSERVREFFPVRLTNLESASLFAPQFRDQLNAGWTLVAPDAGAVPRCQALARAAGAEPLIAHFEKTRTESGVTSSLAGSVTERAIVFDDILDTGETLVACCRGLRSAGVRRIRLAVTHGLFTGTAWHELWTLGVEDILATDSVLPSRAADPRIRVLSCAEVIAQAVRHWEPHVYVEA
jgi:ribose-phosphate pyrophosphokinase